VSRGAFTLLGALPIFFFVLYLATAAQRGKAADSLWMCHVANLLLSIGMFSRSPRLVGIALAWIVLGIPLWALDMWRSGELTQASVLSHLGGLALGMYAAWRLRLSSNPWLAALFVFVALQQLCRWLTPEALNVNLAHAEYAGWEGVFGGYWAYWLATLLAAAAALWGTGRLLTVWFKEEGSCR
jgi:hypothetical protein